MITDVIKYVQGKMKYLNKTVKALLKDVREDIVREEGIEEYKTVTIPIF